MEVQIIVYEGNSCIFLLGNDSFYGRLIYDRGMFLSFADENYPPIPIQYQLDKDKVKALREYSVAPKTHALIQVKVTDCPQLTGKEIILTPLEDDVEGFCRNCKISPEDFMQTSHIPVRNTIAIIDSLGCAPLLVQNDTDDILTIYPDSEIALANFLSEQSNDVNKVSFEIENSLPVTQPKDGWPYSALKGELKDRIPSNMLIQWDKIPGKTEETQEIKYVHDKEERKHLLDGTGEGFPTPPAPDSIHPDANLDNDPEAWLKDVEHSHLSDPQWIKLKKVLLDHSAAFSKSKTEIGCCNYFRVELPLKPGTGYLYNKPRPLPYKHREIAAQHISELLAKGVIRPSNSPHATNVVVVKKKAQNGVVSHRMCVDLRQVNEHSVPNRFPNPLVDEACEKIAYSKRRSSMDFKDAFHQAVLDEKSIPITAFYFNNVLYEYVRLPFGHVCAMNVYCCIMALLCVGYDPASYYADDLMVTTKGDDDKTDEEIFDQHLVDIAGMLDRIIDANLKLVAHKCHWAYTADRPMDWLGFTMENNLLKPQEAKVAAIKNFPVPSSAKQVISFVSTASFYRRFIKSFAKEVQPMYDAANKDPFVWTPEAQKAFERIKEIMCSDLILRLPRQGEPFQLYSDASAGAIGVVLCQIDPVDKKSHPCAYGSRKFNDCEMKLSIPCKELLAIVYGLNLWSFYICGNPIQVFSDCRAWTFLKVQSGASGKISRLALLVSEYDITISYVKGTQNKAADGLSRAYDDGTVKYDDQLTARHPALNELGAPTLEQGEVLKLNDYLEKCDEYLANDWPPILQEFERKQLLAKDSVKSKTKLRDGDPEKNTLSEADFVDKTIQESVILHVDRVRIEDWSKKPKYDGIYPFRVVKPSISVDYNSTIEEETLSTETDKDEELEETPPSDTSDSEITNTTDSDILTASYNVRLLAINESCFTLPAFAELQRQDEFCSDKIALLKRKNSRPQQSGYFMKRNILMRQMKTKDAQEYNVICVPRILVKPLLESSHRSLLSGHFGSQRYYLNMSRKYYWPSMKDDITEFHHQCLPCQYNDKFPVKYLSGHVIRPLWPMHIVHCDLVVGLPKALDGSYAILLLYDGFSRFTFGIPLASEKADYVVNKLMSHFVAAFGLPWALHSDNGRNVDGALIRHLSRMLGVVKTSTPPHTPNANPTETMCGAVGMLLRKALNESDLRYWSLCLPFVLNALNSTVHTATGYTPNSLFFGRFKERDLVPLIPFEAESANVNEYFQKMRRFQELAFQIVRSRNERKLETRRAQWDTTARIHPYKIGDFVLVKNKNPASGPGKKKLRSIYVGPFRVIKAYTSSLIVVPWTENIRLEEYQKEPDLFRLMHRGDIKPFHTRQVSVKHCKPFYGKIDTEDIVDPILLTRFLDSMGIDTEDEIVSEIDSGDWRSMGSYSTDSNNSGPNPPRRPRGPRGPSPPPPPPGPPSSSSGGSSNPPNNNGNNNNNPNVDPNVNMGPPLIPVIEDLDIRHQDIEDAMNIDFETPVPDRMRRHELRKTINDIQDISRNIRRQIEDLEFLADSPDPDIRNRAREDLDRAVATYRRCRGRHLEFNEVEVISSDEDQAPSDKVEPEPRKPVKAGQTLAREMQENLDDQVYGESNLPSGIKTRLRNYRKQQEDLVDIHLGASNYENRIERLENMINSGDPISRILAQKELIVLNKQIEDDLVRYRENPEPNPHPMEVEDETFLLDSESILDPDLSQHSGETRVRDDQPTVDIGPIAGPSHTIRIRAPNIEIDIGPAEKVVPSSSGSSSTVSSRLRRGQVADWLDEHCTLLPSAPSSLPAIPPTGTHSSKMTSKTKPTGTRLEPVSAPIITRSGRQSIPPSRYGDFTPIKYSKSKNSSTKSSVKTTKSSKQDKVETEKGTQLSEIAEEQEPKDPDNPNQDEDN